MEVIIMKNFGTLGWLGKKAYMMKKDLKDLKE